MNASEIVPGVPASATSPEPFVDRYEHDVPRRLERRRLLAVADPRLHDVDPDWKRRLGSGLVVADWLLLIESHPHAQRDVRIEPDEPRVGVVVGRSGFPADRPVERRGLDGRAALDDAAEEAGHHEGGVRPDRVLGFRTVLLQQIAFSIGDLEDRVRLHADALVRECGIRTRHLSQRRLRGTQGDGQVRRNRRLQAESSCV